MTRIDRPPTCDYKVQESIDDAISRMREGQEQKEKKKKMHTRGEVYGGKWSLYDKSFKAKLKKRVKKSRSA